MAALPVLTLLLSSFFSASATEEILAEFEPLLCPHDECLYVGAAALCLLLPADPMYGRLIVMLYHALSPLIMICRTLLCLVMP